MKTYVWTTPTRIFHWYIVIGFILAYMLTDYIQVHAAIGLSVGTMLIFRVIWGLAGPRHSRFKDFPISIKKLKAFIKDVKEQERKYTGHNPLAALIMLLIIFDGIGVAVTGTITALSDDSTFFGTARFGNFEQHREIHEMLVNILIGLVIIHLTGLATSWKFNKDAATAKSMFSGYKYMHGVNANLTLGQRLLALTGGIVVVFVLAYILLQ